MEYLIGLILAGVTALSANVIGLDRDRAFYPTMSMVIALYYVLFALLGSSTYTLLIEIIVAGGFLLFAVWGFKKNLWIVAFALISHGVFDFVRHLWIDNAGVPRWWPGFCLAFDVIIGGWLGVLLLMRRSLLFHLNPGARGK